MPIKPPSFFEVITYAINDIAEHGYDSTERLAYWLREIRDAAERDMTPPQVLERALNETLKSTYDRMVDKAGILRMHRGVQRFTLEHVKPRLRGALDRAILASADLIKLNREATIQKTLQRFSGWSTSIPAGGSEAVNKREVKSGIRRSLTQLPFEERRVLIDQGHKFVANLNHILASGGGAIAAQWHSHWREPNYNYREDHKERDLLFYAIRDCWAIQQGFMRAGPNGYTDQITAPGFEVYCRCWFTYYYNLRDLPSDMLTAKGKKALESARETIRAMSA